MLNQTKLKVEMIKLKNHETQISEMICCKFEKSLSSISGNGSSSLDPALQIFDDGFEQSSAPVIVVIIFFLIFCLLIVFLVVFITSMLRFRGLFFLRIVF